MNKLNTPDNFVSSLLQDQNPLIRLYIMKKTLEQQLTREIQINSYLQNILSTQQSYECKIQHVQENLKEENTTLGKPLSKVTRGKKKKMIRKLKNDTKNIPKNFGKAIITFLEQNQFLVRKALERDNVNFQIFISALKQKKRGINSIADLRGLWLQSQFPYAKLMRVLSHYFLKRGSLNYVFSSRITNHQGHIKYRGRLIQVLRNPQQFTCIKTN